MFYATTDSQIAMMAGMRKGDEQKVWFATRMNEWPCLHWIKIIPYEVALNSNIPFINILICRYSEFTINSNSWQAWENSSS